MCLLVAHVTRPRSIQKQRVTRYTGQYKLCMLSDTDRQKYKSEIYFSTLIMVMVVMIMMTITNDNDNDDDDDDVDDDDDDE